ncbi:hypothetical protein Tco_0271551 [Tanacetum coccineum]
MGVTLPLNVLTSHKLGWNGRICYPEVLDIIAHKHINFYEDYHRFAGVCKSWHSVALYNASKHHYANGPPSRLPSLMLAEKSTDDNDKKFRELFLLSNKSIRKIRLPQVHGKIRLSSSGWLLTVGEDHAAQLINPLSRETINLPKVDVRLDFFSYFVMSTITDIKSVLTQKNFDALCRKFHIPEEVHPQLPTPDQTIHDKPEGKIGIYTRFFDFANYRLPLSSFFVTVLRYFRINFSQLSVIGAAKVSHFEILCRVHNIEPTVGLFRCFYTHFKNKGWISFCKRTEGSPVCYTKPIDSLKNWNNRFFWVDSFACPALFRWHTNKSVPKDPPPKPTDFNAEHYATLVAHPAPFQKFPEVFLCLVGISRYYPLDEETYPSFRDENDEVMDLSAFINVADPTLVKVVERERVEGEAKLLETTVGRTVPLLPVALVRSEASLEDSVNRLFDEGGSGNQVDSAIGIDQNIVVEPEVEHVAAATEASGPNHPAKKLREDYGTSGGHAFGGKSPSVIRKLLASNILNAEIDVAAIPTLPFVTSSVSATLEKDGDDFSDAVIGPNLHTIGDDFTDAVTGPNLRTIGPSARSVDPPIMTEAVVTTEAAGPVVTASTTQRPGNELSMGSREVDSEALHETFVPRWNVPNYTLLDEHDISREFIDHLAPLEIKVLKAQLTVKEAEAAEAIRLRAQIVAMERAHTDEDLEAKELAATVAIAKSQNDSLVDQVNVLEGACSELREQVSPYLSLKEQIEEFQDE